MEERPRHVFRFTTTLAAVLAVLALLLALLYEAYKTYDRNNAMTLHTQEVQSEIEAMRADLYRSESLTRVYYFSDQSSHLARSRDAMHSAMRRLETLRRLTADNHAQRARIPLLRAAIDRRVALRDRMLTVLETQGIDGVRNAHQRSVPSLDEADAMLTAMAQEEQRLFEERKADSDESAKRVIVGLSVILLLAVAGLTFLGSRLARELARRSENEAHLVRASRYAAAHGKALTIFNSGGTREELVGGLLDILGRDLEMPVSAFYQADPFSDQLVLEAKHGAVADLAQRLDLDEGLVGTAARTRNPVTLPTDDPQFALDLGLARVRPRAVIACPVLTHERVWGVLVVASTEASWSDRLGEVERICSQLAIALENRARVERQKLLTEQLAARGDEIEGKNAELENANRLKSEFLATMSHELRTPLNAVIGFSESLRDEIVGPVLPEQKEFLGIIFDSGQHLLSLINDVLDLSKIEAGHMELELEPVDVESLVANSISVVREKALRERVSVHTEADEGLTSFVADARKLKQMVYNLLSNAVKFTPAQGKVTLQVRRAHGDAIVARGLRLTRPLPTAKTETYVEIRVTDTGIGISKEDIDRLFQPFVQLESALTRRHGGTGLGLALVDRLAELHGGAVAVKSEVGKGSEFSLFLPLRTSVTPPRREAPVPNVEVKVTGKRPHTALVIEDDPLAQRLIRDQLEGAGLTVTIVDTAERGLELAQASPPEVIVLDILLPAMDGFGFLEAQHKIASLAKIPVVITSVVADQNRGISLGAFRVLQKPVSKEVLLEAIDAIAGEQRSGTVLVVDDDPQAVRLVAQQLERRFEQVLRAYSGDEAIKVASSRKPDVIVLDLMMPDRSGFEVVEILKAKPETAQIPVAILTAKSLSPSERGKLSTHVEVIMQKSEFNHGRFLNEVRRALSQQPKV